ncbi:hypothetical protein JK358_37350 [Nocardia sp. 2]|uniref:Uncharacterized protein n=1 Tax=Nocardia acididurans TaxID=2802282 RepID=A0ABS1MK92_9NOCA|nr:hypothetical protein [Nocardia acididurans]MBL1080079.1 hypothetical protein [Nocardia acididurans]
MTTLAQDYRQLPDTVTTPLYTLLSYGLWAAELICVAWLLVSAGRYMALRHSTVETYAEAHNGLLRTLAAAVLATSSLTIANAVLLLH